MKEEDIDKLFAKELRGVQAPISDADWKAFQSQASKGTFWTTRWFLSVCALLLISGSVAAFIISNPSAESRYQARAERDSLLNKDLLLTDSEDVGLSAKAMELSKSSALFSIIENEAEEAVSSVNRDLIEETVQGSSNPGNSSSTSHQTLDVSQNRAIGNISATTNSTDERKKITASKSQNTKTSSAIHSRSGGNPDRNQANAVGLPDVDQQPKSGNDDSFVNSPEMVKSSLTRESNSELLLELELLELKQPTFALAYPSFSSKKKEISQFTGKLLHWFLFIRPATDRVWGTNISAGIGASYSISRLNISLGAGYFSSGDLEWKQERSEVTYGFARYEVKETLTTQKLDFLIVPLDFAYRLGGQTSVFAGVEGMIKLNARQTFIGKDDLPQEGYLYSTRTPNFILNFRSGFGYDLNEFININAGFSWSPSTWESVDRSPLGGFLQVNYVIK
ncbi:MAG: hypothetical protein AAGC47_00090 [Bacteroidota bacterium]